MKDVRARFLFDTFPYAHFKYRLVTPVYAVDSIAELQDPSLPITHKISKDPENMHAVAEDVRIDRVYENGTPSTKIVDDCLVTPFIVSDLTGQIDAVWPEPPLAKQGFEQAQRYLGVCEHDSLKKICLSYIAAYGTFVIRDVQRRRPVKKKKRVWMENGLPAFT